MRTGQRGLLSSVVIGGLGFVFTGLGLFDSHTTEALPFGVVMLVVGVVMALPSWKAVRATLRDEALVAPSLDAPSELAPPMTMKCPSCAAPAPLRLSNPTAVTCAHCGTTSPVPASLASALSRAAALVKQRDAGEQRITEVLRGLPAKHVALRARLLKLAAGLGGLGVLVALFGWGRRLSEDDWHAYVLFALFATPAAVLLGLTFARLVPRLARSLVGHWAALQLPGVQGLSCRVCGGPLPTKAAAVLACEFCGADNLAGKEVQALVAHDAAWASTGALAVGRRSAKADELAAFAVTAFPVVTLVVWFAIGAFAGGAGARALGRLETAPWSSLPLALVKTPQGDCVAWVEPVGGEVRLHFGAEDKRTVSREQFERDAVEPHLVTSALVEKHLNGHRVQRIYIELNRPFRVQAETTAGWLSFPAADLGGQSVCLTE